MGMGHLYNNYLSDIDSYGNYSRGSARCVIENSYFENTNNPYYHDTDAELVASGNKVVNCTGSQTTQGSAFDPSSYYDYTLDPVDDIPILLQNSAGPINSISY
jgi:pectate lyase